MTQKPKIAFFGGEPLSVPILKKILETDLVPELVVCSPDRPAGRGMRIVSANTKIFALEHNFEVFQPESLKSPEVRQKLESVEWDLFIVVAYNHLLPNWLLQLPKKGCINVHPSLLPALRGPSPIRTAILTNQPDVVGVTIMLLDEKMDTGPILEQAICLPESWPIPGPDLDNLLAELGGELLVDTTPSWLTDNIKPQQQDHTQATYSRKFTKGENELSLNPLSLPSGEEALLTLCKIYAWQGIGDTFFIHNGRRIKVKAAGLSASGSLEIIRIIPEGKQEMDFSSYVQFLAS